MDLRCWMNCAGGIHADIPVIILTARELSDADLERCNRGVAASSGRASSAPRRPDACGDCADAPACTGPDDSAADRKAMAYIHGRYADPITREEIADHIGISADYLTDCFRLELGITPSALHPPLSHPPGL